MLFLSISRYCLSDLTQYSRARTQSVDTSLCFLAAFYRCRGGQFVM